MQLLQVLLEVLRDVDSKCGGRWGFQGLRPCRQWSWAVDGGSGGGAGEAGRDSQPGDGMKTWLDGTGYRDRLGDEPEAQAVKASGR